MLCLDAGNQKKAQVKYCGCTTNLTLHLKTWHKGEHKAMVEDKEETPKVSILKHFEPQPKSVHKWPKSSEQWKTLTMSLAKWVCKSSRSTRIVEDEGFVAFLGLACPAYDPPSRITLARYIRQLYESEHKRVKDALESIEFCAITTDGGTSSDATSFQDTNVHYIDEDWQLKSHCLAVTENKEAHTAVNYRQNVDEVLDEFAIKGKVVKAVIDNENKMKASFDKKERTGCMAHIIHSSVSEGYKKATVVKEVIEKNQKIATKYHKSYAFKYNVEEEQKKRGLPVKAILQDVPTRWGSTRSSTGSFLDKKEKEEGEGSRGSDVFQEQFQNMDAINAALRKIQYRGEQKLDHYLLTQADMDRISTVNRFLTKLDIYTTTLGGDKFATSSVVYPVMASMKKLLKEDLSDPVYIGKMKEAILEDFTTRLNTNVDGNFLLLATALDPHWKDLKVISKEGRERAFKRLREEMSSLEKFSRAKKDEPAPSKPKRRLLDFDESDEELEEEKDALDTELTRFLNKIIHIS